MHLNNINEITKHKNNNKIIITQNIQKCHFTLIKKKNNFNQFETIKQKYRALQSPQSQQPPKPHKNYFTNCHFLHSFIRYLHLRLSAPHECPFHPIIYIPECCAAKAKVSDRNRLSRRARLGQSDSGVALDQILSCETR